MPELLDLLKRYWGYDRFRGSQEQIIRCLESKKDVIALMPTGGGKSLCYQLPAIAGQGIAIVVSPLIALMEDQLSGLKKRGIKALGIYGPLSEVELVQKLDNADFGSYKLLYLSPERLKQDLVLERLSRLEVSLIAIDEAHCVSQWGFDFRPAYLECHRLKELHPESPMIALTATATPEVLKDMQDLLGISDARVFKDSIVRENIAYRVLQTEDKHYRLRTLCQQAKGSCIVYVRSRRSSKKLAEYLGTYGLAAQFFHGGLPADEKKSRLKSWQQGTFPIMVATNAFGMGVDKADVRLVVHFDPPETLEHYFQEAGRAGRDEEAATAILLLGPSDIEDSENYFLGSLPDTKDLIVVYQKLNRYFGLAYGERPETPFNFRFEAFCEAYGLSSRKTFNALEILDRQGVIRLEQRSHASVRVQFTCGKSRLWEYLDTYPEFRDSVQTLLRTYGGLFDFPTPIRMLSISKKMGIPESVLVERLRQLDKDGIISLELHQGDLQLEYLQPREDERTIHAFAGAVISRQKVKREKVKQFSWYLRTTDVCRQQQLLAYFGESPGASCGRCDVCLPELESNTKESIQAGIIRHLQRGPKTSRQLIEEGLKPEKLLLETLQDLLSSGVLRIGDRNEYRIAKT